MMKFEVKPEHLKLMAHFNVGWQNAEFGAPEIDPKRPYGNSDVYQDMIEALGLKELKKGVYEFELFGEKWLLKGEGINYLYLDGKDEARLLEKLDKLHKETETALKACLSAQKFEAGLYEGDEFDNWTKVE